MNIYTYLQLYTKTTTFLVNTKQIIIEGVVPFTLGEVVVAMLRLSQGSLDQQDFTANVISFQVLKYKRLEVSAFLGSVRYSNVDLISDENMQILLDRLVESSRAADDMLVDFFDEQFEVLDLPAEVKDELHAKFDPSKYKLTERAKQKYFHLIAEKVQEQFEGHLISEFDLTYTDDQPYIELVLENDDTVNWNYENIGRVLLELDKKVEVLHLDIPQNFDLIYYQLLRNSIWSSVHIDSAGETQFTITLVLTFDPYSNEDYFKEAGPGYYHTLLDNVCLGNFDKDALYGLMEYFAIPSTYNLDKVCSTIRKRLAYFNKWDFQELANKEERLQLRANLLYRMEGL